MRDEILLTRGPHNSERAVISRNNQLTHLEIDGVNYMHPAGRTPSDPNHDWPNSAYLMGPIIGPAKDGVIEVIGKETPIGQHGILRHMEAEVISQKPHAVRLRYEHKGGNTPIVHSDGTESFWPYSFKVDQIFSLVPDGFKMSVSFENTDDKIQPFAIGYHPGIRTKPFGEEGKLLFPHNKPLEYVQTISESPAKAITEMQNGLIHYGSFERVHAQVIHDFRNTMVWSPKGADFICLEAVTQLPPDELTTEFDLEREYEPGESEIYNYELRIIGQEE